MRTLKLITNDNAKVLIIDSSGSEHISRCIPHNYSVKTVETRSVIPLILDFNFFIILVKMVWRFGFSPKSLFFSIVRHINPKVVITFIDNMSIMGDLAYFFQDKLVISIQNGVRFNNYMDTGNWNSNYNLPNYFGFGKYEKWLINNKQVNIKRYEAIGSLMMGLFLSSYKKLDVDDSINSGKLCFISQYRKNMMSSSVPFKNLYFEYQKDIYRLVENFITKNDFYLNVCMVCNKDHVDFLNEKLYFKTINNFNDINLLPRIPEEFSSYKECIEAEVIITMDSTLAFEMFGYGKKVLFCGLIDNNFMSDRGSAEIFNIIPNFSKFLKNDNFQDKILFLINMSNEDYLSSTKIARDFLMSYRREYPHEIIAKHITSFIEG